MVTNNQDSPSKLTTSMEVACSILGEEKMAVKHISTLSSEQGTMWSAELLKKKSIFHIWDEIETIVKDGVKDSEFDWVVVVEGSSRQVLAMYQYLEKHYIGVGLVVAEWEFDGSIVMNLMR